MITTILALWLAFREEPQVPTPPEELSSEWTLHESGKFFEKREKIRVTCPAEGEAWLRGPWTYHLRTRTEDIRVVDDSPQLRFSVTIAEQYELRLPLGFHFRPKEYHVRVGHHIYYDFDRDGQWDWLTVDSGKGDPKGFGWREGHWQLFPPVKIPSDVPLKDPLLDDGPLENKDQSEDDPFDETSEEEKRKLRREWRPDKSGQLLQRFISIRVTRPQGVPEETAPWTFDLAGVKVTDQPNKFLSMTMPLYGGSRYLIKAVGELELKLLLNSEGKPHAVRVQVGKNVYYDHDRDGVWDEFIDRSQRGGPKRFLWKDETWKQVELPKEDR